MYLLQTYSIGRSAALLLNNTSPHGFELRFAEPTYLGKQHTIDGNKQLALFKRTDNLSFANRVVLSFPEPHSL